MINLIFLLLLQSKSWAFALTDFSDARDHFLTIYGPIVKEAKGLELKIKLDDEVKNYFGGMSVEDNTMSIMMGSEFDREKGITPDAYSFILCHEVGHLLGGAPLKETRGKGALYSSEGQSDYFAASTCLKKVFKNDLGPYTDINVTERVRNLCESKNTDRDDQLICMRVANAGRELFNYIKIMFTDYNLDIPAPDMDQIEEAGKSVGSEYPSFQCRLNTIVAGATDQKRPACWYKG